MADRMVVPKVARTAALMADCSVAKLVDQKAVLSVAMMVASMVAMLALLMAALMVLHLAEKWVENWADWTAAMTVEKMVWCSAA